MRMRSSVAIPIAALALAGVLAPALPATAKTSTNVARGRPYTVDPAPSYALCTEPGDASQLTDGFVTRSNFWTEKTTVGWQNALPVTITIDLGRVTPIAGASFRTAAGKAGAEWPATIQVFAGGDEASFSWLGDLVALSNAENGPPGAGYRIHSYVTNSLHGHGRYLRFVVQPTGPFLFCDEIEVYGGPAAWAAEPMAGVVVRDTTAFFVASLLQRRVETALRRDLAVARQRVASGPGRDRVVWNDELSRLDAAIGSLADIDRATFRAVLPMGPVHTAIFALIGTVDAAGGQPALRAWLANPWDFLSPADPAPEAAVASRELVLLRGETRPAAVNVRNASGDRLVVGVKVDGLDGATVRAAEVAWTETTDGVAVAAALPDAAREGDAFRISVPAGMTRQVWLWVSAGSLGPGRHAGKVSIAAAGRPPIDVPMPVRVVDAAFPSATRLHVGGWDYTNQDSIYGVTAANVTPLIAHLRSRGVDSPWATNAALPFGTFDATGRMIASPDTTNFDRWASRWPDSRRYMVFLNVPDGLGPIATGDPAFTPAVKQWLAFWVGHAATRGVRPEQLHLLLVDEPHDAAGTARMMPWARAIRGARMGVRIWEDPTFFPSEPFPAAFVDAIDVLCVNRKMGFIKGSSFWKAAAAQRSPSRSLEIYQGRSPTHTADPYTYSRLQAWQAFAIGGDGSSFWAFGDTGDTNSWNALAGTKDSYTPLFLAPDSVTAGKHMEAIVESAHDFEVLALLRDAVDAAAPGTPEVAAARALLRDGPVRVLAAPGAGELAWQSAKDRATADAVRTDAADLLVRLRGARAGGPG